MSKHIFWTFELTIKDGQLDNLKNLMKEMVEATEKNEPGTLVYEWTKSKNNSICQIHERYVDSESARAHLSTFTEKYAERLMKTGDATSFIVYGTPDHELKQVLDGFGAVYMATIGGLFRKKLDQKPQTSHIKTHKKIGLKNEIFRPDFSYFPF